MKSSKRLMSAMVAALAVIAVPLSASAKDHNRNYVNYHSAPASTPAFNHAAKFGGFNSAPAPRAFVKHNAASFAPAPAPQQRSSWNTPEIKPAHFDRFDEGWHRGWKHRDRDDDDYRGGYTTYNNYYSGTPAYAAPAAPVYYGGYQGGYPGYAGYAGGPCANPYKAEKHQYNFGKLMNERQNLQYEISRSRSNGNWSNAHRLNTQLEYVNQQLGNFHNSCGAAAGYNGGYGYNSYNNYGGYSGYGSPYGGFTSMVPFLGNFIR